MTEPYGIAAFRSRQQVVLASEQLRRAGINASIVSTPKEISAGCGLSIRFDLKDAAAVKSGVGRPKTGSLIGVYRVEPYENGRHRLSALSLNR